MNQEVDRRGLAQYLYSNQIPSKGSRSHQERVRRLQAQKDLLGIVENVQDLGSININAHHIQVVLWGEQLHLARVSQGNGTGTKGRGNRALKEAANYLHKEYGVEPVLFRVNGTQVTPVAHAYEKPLSEA